MEIILWPYSKKMKSRIINDGLANNLTMIFHNPGMATEQFEYIEGTIREYIPSFQAAQSKFENFEGKLHLFHCEDMPRSKDKVTKILKANKIKFTDSNRPYPL